MPLAAPVTRATLPSRYMRELLLGCSRAAAAEPDAHPRVTVTCGNIVSTIHISKAYTILDREDVKSYRGAAPCSLEQANMMGGRQRRRLVPVALSGAASPWRSKVAAHTAPSPGGCSIVCSRSGPSRSLASAARVPVP